MKILFIRIAGRISGAETYNINLLKELQKYSSIHITSLTNLKELSDRIKVFGGDAEHILWMMYEIGTKKDLAKAIFLIPIFLVSYLRNIRKLEKNRKFDIICLQSMTEKVFLSLVLRLLGYKIVWIEHGPLFVSKSSSIIKFLYKIASNFVDKIIAVSRDTKRDLVGGGITADKVQVIYIGIDLERFRPLNTIRKQEMRNRLQIKLNATVVGFLGTVTSEKGIENFIDISKKLISEHNNFFFVVIGDGPLLTWAKDEARKLGIDKQYFFSGFVDDVRDYLSAVDLMLFPTHHNEGISMAILEAQSIGIPVFATDIGGNKEIIQHGYNGFLYPMSDTKSTLSDILRVAHDLKLYMSLKTSSRKIAIQKFDIHKQAKEFKDLFFSL